METAVERLVKAGGYPEGAPTGARSFMLQVDGGNVFVEEVGGRVRLSRKLSDEPADWPLLAACAPGRMLREDAIAAIGPVPGAADRKPAFFLWQDAPATADAHALKRLLETFLDSCDWWHARTSEGRSAGEPAAMPASAETIIMP